MKYRGIFEYEYPTEHKTPVSIDVHLHGDCVKGKIIEWEYRPLEQNPTTKNDLEVDWESYKDVDGNSLDDLILEVLQNNFDCGNTYGYKVADEIIGLLPSVTPQEPFMNKLCISSKVCEHDKEVVLDKIRAEIDSINLNEIVLKYENSLYGFQQGVFYGFQQEVLKILDKYKTESEE